MPFAADQQGKNYVLGRGKLYFGRYTPAQLNAGLTDATQPEGGHKYVGNTPSISFSTSEDTLDHFDSDAGVRTKDESVSLQLDRSGSFETDNINVGNLALLFLSDGAGAIVQAAITAATYNILKAGPGGYHQIGATAALPSGVRSVSAVSVNKGVSFATLVAALNNYEVDEATGVLRILPNSPDIPVGTDIQVTFSAAAVTREQVISKNTPIYASLQYRADNPKGTNRDMLIPYVKITPDGDFNLKGDDWQTISFNFEILKKGALEGVYVDGRAVPTV